MFRWSRAGSLAVLSQGGVRLLACPGCVEGAASTAEPGTIAHLALRIVSSVACGARAVGLAGAEDFERARTASRLVIRQVMDALTTCSYPDLSSSSIDTAPTEARQLTKPAAQMPHACSTSNVEVSATEVAGATVGSAVGGARLLTACTSEPNLEVGQCGEWRMGVWSEWN